MYVTDKVVCFYSNLFGVEKKLIIQLADIKNISKVNTALVIPNAISIETGQ